MAGSARDIKLGVLVQEGHFLKMQFWKIFHLKIILKSGERRSFSKNVILENFPSKNQLILKN